MNRTDLAKHIRARLEPLVTELADVLLTRIEDQIAEVVDVARSALLSEWTPEVAPTRETPPEQSIRRSAVGHEPQAPASKRRGAGARIVKLAKKHRVITAKDLPAVIASNQEQRAELAPKKRAPMTCSKCGAVGYRADGCGRTHNVADDQDDDEPEPTSKTPPPFPVPFIAKRDRFEAIEQSVAKRTGTLPTSRATVTLGGNRP